MLCLDPAVKLCSPRLCSSVGLAITLWRIGRSPTPPWPAMADEDAGSGAREGITAEWLASLPAMADVASTMPWAKFEEAAEALRSIFSSREAVLDASPAAINFCGFDSRLTSRLTEKERGPPPGTPARRLYDAMLEVRARDAAGPRIVTKRRVIGPKHWNCRASAGSFGEYGG